MKKTFEENIELEGKKRAPDSRKAVAEYITQMKNFEADGIAVIKKQNVFLRKLVVGLMVITGGAVFAVAALTPLKTVEPYLVRIDNLTGAADVVHPLQDAAKSYDEKQARYWLVRAIYEREGYYWSTVQASYDSFKLFSTSHVFQQYESYIFSDKSPVKVFEDSKSIKVDHRGTTFITSGETMVAQVRLSKTVLEKDGKPSAMYPVTYWMATATFDYDKKIKRKSEEEINPLGFQLTSYRIDAIKS